MWRRVASLSSSLISSSNSSFLGQANGAVGSKERTPFITFVLGGPGSGKGTQCIKIVETFGFKHLSAGDLLRREIACNTADGAMILDTIKEGKIVPSEVTVKLIQKEIESSDNHKILIDGFPRSEENRIAFEKIVGAEPNIVLFFDCPEEEMVKRVLSRNQGRVDDNIDTIRKRLKVFEALNLPVINYYSQRGKLYTINAVGTVDEIFEQVRPVFNSFESDPKMVALLSPSFHSTKLTFHCSSKSKKNKKREQLNRKQLQKSKRIAFPYPESSPTPLLINHKPFTQTRLQALDAVVQDLEASVKKGINIDTEIFASLLETCYQLNSIDHGIKVHSLIPKTMLRRNTGISSKLLRLYASSGHIESAHQVFDEMYKRNESAFPWNSLISGYAELGQYEDALALYFQMEEEGVGPDRFTFPRALKACAGIGMIQIGEAVHRDVVRKGFGNDGFVLNALCDMYAKCGDIVKARRVFDSIVYKDMVSWNSMLTSYIRHGLLFEALEVFRGMIQEGFDPDPIAMSTVLSGFSSLKIAAQIHGWVLRRGIEWNLSVVNALILVYSKHEKFDQAGWLFHRMPDRDIVSWNSIISGHCKHPQALKYFEQMESSGTSPDTITFVAILSACAHLGLVKDGEQLFSLMRKKYAINPTMEHYACMVNLYGRAGLIDEAYNLIVERMEFDAGPTVWGALLYACSVHGNVDIGEIAARNLFELEPDNEHNFELLMKIYSNAGRLEDVERVRTMMLDRGL
ncbi:Adenylate kinase [Corchorus capsularis]|uniref:adenylate kinase n=1 Tax=Corchorus capsularis TaxID=210143 RepID=A0A1R3ITD5_COCAP|nr:Adenylate kinase [Corchorus capsularis]